MPIAIKINPKDTSSSPCIPSPKARQSPSITPPSPPLRTSPRATRWPLRPSKAAKNVIKYGFPIGHATADAVPGTWMHTHNIHTNLSGEIEYSYHPNVHPLTPAAPGTFMGYRRKDGRAAIRNEIWIIPLSAASTTAPRRSCATIRTL